MNQNQKSIVNFAATGVVLSSMYKIIGTFVDIVPQRTTFQKVVVFAGKVILVSFATDKLVDYIEEQVEETSDWFTKNIVNKELVDKVTDEE